MWYYREYVIRSIKHELVKHKIQNKGKQRDRLEPTRVTCHQLKILFDQDLSFLSFLLFLPRISRVLAEFRERKEREKEKK